MGCGMTGGESLRGRDGSCPGEWGDPPQGAYLSNGVVAKLLSNSERRQGQGSSLADLGCPHLGCCLRDTFFSFLTHLSLKYGGQILKYGFEGTPSGLRIWEVAFSACLWCPQA